MINISNQFYLDFVQDNGLHLDFLINNSNQFYLDFVQDNEFHLDFVINIHNEVYLYLFNLIIYTYCNIFIT
jgi:hypothetical protein